MRLEMIVSNQFFFTVTYTLLTNGWCSQRTVRAVDDKSALLLFAEWWERDGSQIEELSSFYISDKIQINY